MKSLISMSHNISIDFDINVPVPVPLTQHCSVEPPIGCGPICSQETKCTAMLYDTHRF